MNESPAQLGELRNIFIQFYANPTFQLISGIPSQSTTKSPPPDNQLKAELNEIKSTLQALTRTVTGLQSKSTLPPPKVVSSTQSPGKITLATPTYATKATTPARPSLVVDLSHNMLPKESRPSAADLCESTNNKLHSHGHRNTILSTARWTNKGNLMLTASPLVSSQQLHTLTLNIENLVIEYLSVFHSDPVIILGPNAKWAKLLINGIPTEISSDRRAYTLNECHNALNSHNLIYFTLKITQKPSWVCPPSTLKPRSSSLLSIAFKDPDDSQLKALLSSRQLYLFGTRAMVKHWKATSTKSNPPPPNRSTHITPF